MWLHDPNGMIARSRRLEWVERTLGADAVCNAASGDRALINPSACFASPNDVLCDPKLFMRSEAVGGKVCNRPGPPPANDPLVVRLSAVDRDRPVRQRHARTPRPGRLRLVCSVQVGEWAGERRAVGREHLIIEIA
jgi:hypothetical protein